MFTRTLCGVRTLSLFCMLSVLVIGCGEDDESKSPAGRCHALGIELCQKRSVCNLSNFSTCFTSYSASGSPCSTAIEVRPNYETCVTSTREASCEAMDALNGGLPSNCTPFPITFTPN